MYYKNTYFIGTMSEETAKNIVEIRKQDKIEYLRHKIKNLSDEEISRVKATKTNYLDGENGTLRDEQTVGVAFLYLSRSAMLGDSVGIGKTVQTAGLCNLLFEDNPNFTFCYLGEKSSISEIRDKLIKFTGRYIGFLSCAEEKDVTKYKQDREGGIERSVVGNHALLLNNTFIEDCAKRPYDLLIIDESAFLKNKSTQIYKNTKDIVKLFNRVVLLNATPIEMSVKDLYNQLNLLDTNYLPKLSEFYSDYCIFNKDRQIIGCKNEEVFKKAIELRYLARRRREQGAVYKDNKAKIYGVELSTLQKELKNKTSMYQLLYDYPCSINKMVKPTIVNTPKISGVLDILEHEIKGEKVYIYSHFIEAQQYLEQILIEKGYKAKSTAKKTGKARNQIIEDFVNGEVQILITNIRKGIDLNTCNHLIIYSLEYNPTTMLQVEGRMTRDINIQGKRVYILLTRGEVKKLNEIFKSRVNMSDSVINYDYSLILDVLNNQKGISYKDYSIDT